jgi:hypothetical protein
MAKRKPLTEEQRQARADRLAVAREKRYQENPPAYKQFSPHVVALPDDDDFSLKNVREWIKEARSHKQAEHRSHQAGTKGALAKRITWEGYISQLESYLKSGDYISPFAGGDMERRVGQKCVAMAYFPNGKPKRQIGVWYKDYMTEWTPELENAERLDWGMDELKFSESGSVLVEDKPYDKKADKPTRKKRTMSPEAKAAFVERMRKAREKNAK